MNGIKCSSCSLVNLAADYECRRCGQTLGNNVRSSSPVSPRDRARRSSPLYPLLALTVIGAAVYYIFSGAEKSIENVQPIAPAPAGAPASRKDAEQKQLGAYKNAVQNSNGLSESQKHNADIQNLMPK